MWEPLPSPSDGHLASSLQTAHGPVNDAVQLAFNPSIWTWALAKLLSVLELYDTWGPWHRTDGQRPCGPGGPAQPLPSLPSLPQLLRTRAPLPPHIDHLRFRCRCRHVVNASGESWKSGNMDFTGGWVGGLVGGSAGGWMDVKGGHRSVTHRGCCQGPPGPAFGMGSACDMVHNLSQLGDRCWVPKGCGLLRGASRRTARELTGSRFADIVQVAVLTSVAAPVRCYYAVTMEGGRLGIWAA